jgi:hypothetical protein
MSQRGAGKKKIDGPPVHFLNPRPTHPPSDFFFWTFFLVRFWAFLGNRQGEFKNTTKMFLEIIHVEKGAPKTEENIC